MLHELGIFCVFYGILVALLVQTLYGSLGEWMSERLKPKYQWFAKFGSGFLYWKTAIPSTLLFIIEKNKTLLHKVCLVQYYLM
jgi:hypothetical protein